jgi:hypothetical protein
MQDVEYFVGLIQFREVDAPLGERVLSTEDCWRSVLTSPSRLLLAATSKVGTSS